MERMPNSACNRGGRYSAEVAYLDTTRFHIRATGALPQWRSKPALPRGLGPGRGRVCRFALDLDRLVQGSPLRRTFYLVALACAECLAPNRVAISSRMSRVICSKRNFPTLFRGNEIFQPFALATPLYSVNLRLSGGELLRLCSVVR